MRLKKHSPARVLDRARVRALLFDVDGTLSDSDDHMVESLSQMLRPLGFALDEDRIHRLARWMVRTGEGPGNFVLEMADRLGVDPLLARFLDRRARRADESPSGVRFPIIPGVREMLEALHGKYALAVVSARNEVTTRLFLRLNDLEKYFQVVATSQTCPRTKPFPDPLLYAARNLGVPIADCLMVGDTVTDVRAALAAGAQSLSVLCGFGEETELRRAGTGMILPSTADMAGFLMGNGAEVSI